MALLVTGGIVTALLLLRAGLDDRYYIGSVSNHYDGERFFNPGESVPNNGVGALLKWKLAGGAADWPDTVPVTPAIPAERVEGDAMVVTAVGHATMLVQTAGLNILTDPVWSERVSPVRWAGPKRVRAPGVRFEDLPKIDVVLVSHNHYDHLDLDTLQRLWRRDRPVIVTPLGNAALMARRGITAFARDWGDSIGIKPGTEVFVERVQHWSSRRMRDRNRALWGGFTVTTTGGNIYFAGDCGYGDGAMFRDAAARHGPYRLALLPVGAYEPRWFMKPQHMNPTESVAAFRDLGATHGIGIHWGVWQLTDEAIDAPREDLRTALTDAQIASERFAAPVPGDVLIFSPNP